MPNKLVSIFLICIAILIFAQGYLSGFNKAENSCKSDKLEIQKLNDLNNEKIINAGVQVIKREYKNKIIPISDDLKWLQINYAIN